MEEQVLRQSTLGNFIHQSKSYNYNIVEEMIIYLDAFTGEEILSDSYKFEELFEQVVIAVKSRLVVKGEDKVDVGCGDAFGGKNEEEEGGAGEAGPAVEKVNDLIECHHYQETSFTQEEYFTYYKAYCGQILNLLKDKAPHRVEPFKKGAVEYRKFLLEKFNDLSFYTPPSYDCEHCVILSYYKNEEDLAPTFLYMMDGLRGQKS